MEIDSLYIEQVIATRTWKLRQQVLYPEGSLKDVMIDADFDGTHFAATIAGELIGVISVFKIEEGHYQFRKFAVLPQFQGNGIGTALFKSVVDFCRLWNGVSLFCDARIAAVPFYEKLGMHIKGEHFFKKELEYVRMEIGLFNQSRHQTGI
ncbi:MULTISPECIES: GNAT family N-acetyltransferase [Sphingobacterium]|uniref:GNAT family N-acetyltransferase n=1 Tax=Sphingobacterium kitahiroshimense TaxID=470446 RepID=A0ABV0BY39_9SPHI|nr:MULTISPECIES: GNAT family N-acetyltransferase [unclassified Sphingobacterium]MCS3556308.1 GNAT superfamily N-acetyltransferase [Sphingobacterium sp. JUb21]QQD12054.1 GNAT family N-acetyltransferase [Sphingobacterium sp. UDSM-2020]TCR08677.1 putative GNAT family N-acyltransferase [Sphingobacterium sp. JUb20]